MKLKITCRCQSCSHKYSFTAESNDEQAADIEDRPCPKCEKAQTTRGMDVSAGKAPAVGGSNIVKAMDIAAKITMEDYGMTDLKSDGREGAIMAPSLPPQQQAMADGMFGQAKRGSDIMKTRGGIMAAQMAAQARQGKPLGAFAQPANQTPTNPIELIHRARARPPVHIINERRS